MSEPATQPALARDDRQPLGRPTDTAQQSLTDALRVSFWVLKALMVVLLVLYLVSGVFNVREQEKAVRLRFGRIAGRPGGQVLEPGGPYFSLPYPFEQVVSVPTSPRQLELTRAFWYETTPAHAGRAIAQPGPLHPERDGSLITGDVEIVHARWSVTYAVKNPIDYLTNVRDQVEAQRLVRAVTEAAVVHAVAGLTTDHLIRAQTTGQARRLAQAVLDGIGSGIRITTLSVKDPVYPLSIRAAVQAVLNAESVRAQLIDKAQQEWDRILVGTAGEAFEPLLELIEAYEWASQSGDREGIAGLDQILDTAFTSLAVDSKGVSVRIGGAVAELIHDATTYRTEVVAQIRGEADYFNSLLPQYRQNPRIVLNRLWQDARDRILTGDIETMYMPPGQTYLELNRDPKIQEQRERKQLSREKEERATGR